MATNGWGSVTEADLRKRSRGSLPAEPKPSKYRNQRCEWNGEKFDSKAEMDWYLGLKMRERAGEIRQLQRQVPLPLYAPIFTNGVVHSGATVVVAHYVADALYFEKRADGAWHKVVADRKSKITRTAVYRLKAKWLLSQEGIEIQEVL